MGGKEPQGYRLEIKEQISVAGGYKSPRMRTIPVATEDEMPRKGNIVVNPTPRCGVNHIMGD